MDILSIQIIYPSFEFLLLFFTKIIVCIKNITKYRIENYIYILNLRIYKIRKNNNI